MNSEQTGSVKQQTRLKLYFHKLILYKKYMNIIMGGHTSASDNGYLTLVHCFSISVSNISIAILLIHSVWSFTVRA